jgi:hypothetical protein
MTISWYFISISLQSEEEAIFNGYFSVDNATNLVTSFYETINGSTNFNNNILGPAMDPWAADNVFNSDLSFTFHGVNITSISLQNTFNTATPYYNLYYKYWLYKPPINIPINIVVTPISDPSIYVNDGSQLYDFLNSDREQCIITNDIGVNFNLTSSNGIKTILSDNLIKITKI